MANYFTFLFVRSLCVLALFTALATTALAQTSRQQYLQAEPLAKVAVQSLISPESPDYDSRNALFMFQPEQEDSLSFYARTQDGEWHIPSQVDRDDPWVRLLVLSPGKPALVEFAIELNGKPFRTVREAWIDQLQAKAKAVFLVRTGVATVEAIAAAALEKNNEKNSGKNNATKNTDTPKNDTSAASKDAVEDEDKAGDAVPMVAAQRREAQTASRQLINYLAANQSTADREEVRWLLAERTGGPTLLTLGSAFAWKRADVAPLWHALDQDGDQVLSSAEIAQASATFKQADINQDDNVAIDELQRIGKQQPTNQRTKSHPLVVVLDAHTDWKSLNKHLQEAYPEQGEVDENEPLLKRIQRGDRSLKTSDLVNLGSLAPELVCRISFGNKAASMTLLAAGSVAIDGWRFTSASEQVITVEQETTYLELTAAQDKEAGAATTKIQQTQIAIGAVVDGYPLFRLLDRDNSRKLTLREQRRVGELLATLDRNQNGQIEASEIPNAIRLAVTQGPQVHQFLNEATAAQRKTTSHGKATAPVWFTGMDTNRDGDISRREFQGSSTQFAKLDQDNDGLISKSEIQENKTP